MDDENTIFFCLFFVVGLFFPFCQHVYMRLTSITVERAAGPQGRSAPSSILVVFKQIPGCRFLQDKKEKEAKNFYFSVL